MEAAEAAVLLEEADIVSNSVSVLENLSGAVENHRTRCWRRVGSLFNDKGTHGIDDTQENGDLGQACRNIRLESI